MLTVRLPLVICLLGSSVLAGDRPLPKIELLATARIDGTVADLSGETNRLENGEPHNRFGGISAIEYTGSGDLYWGLSDRGPDDGATGFRCRRHLLEITCETPTSLTARLTVLQTQLLRPSGARARFTGSAAASAVVCESVERLDPEGIRLQPDGHFFVSDEYGPKLIEFDTSGVELRRFSLPAHLMVDQPSDAKEKENSLNHVGRASNRGMEGLAQSSDGRFLVGLMQSSLLQDGEPHEKYGVTGRNCRIVEVEIATGRIREFLYLLDDAANGTNEILATGPGEYLVIERDSRFGADAAYRKLIRIHVDGATDISRMDSLPADATALGIVPVTKEVALDFLDPAIGLVGTDMPEKIEGLTFGPALPDGRRSLVVAIDNDFEAQKPTIVWMFAVGDSAPAGKLPAVTSAR